MRVLSLRVAVLCCLFGLLSPLLAQEAPAPPAPVENAAPAPSPQVPTVSTPSSEEPLPPPAPGARYWKVSAERVVLQDGGGVRFLGKVNFGTEGYGLTADQVDYDAQGEIAHATGNVSLTVGSSTYHGEELHLHIPSKEFGAQEFAVEYPPGALGKKFIGSTYLQGKGIAGTPNLQKASKVRATTCDLDEPHYYFIAREVEIRPGDKIIGHDVDFYIRGYHVLRLPWFIIDLKRRQSPLTPDVGRNDYEGYYIRTLYQYAINDQNLGGIRVDQTEKLGTGFGLDHYYTVPSGYGEAFLYGRQDMKEYVVRLDHDQFLPWDTTLKLTGDVRKNSQFSYLSTTQTDINTQLSRDTEHADVKLTYIRRLNKGTYYSNNDNANLTYDINTTGGKFHYSGAYSSYGSALTAGKSADQELWNRLQWTRQLGFGNVNLFVDKRIDMDGDTYTGDDNFSGLQRLPYVYLQTDDKQLKWNMLKYLPGQLSAGWGIFDEQPYDVQLNRYYFNWQSSMPAYKMGRFLTLSPTGSFRQTIYGDKDSTAMYVINSGLTARAALGSVSNVFSYQKNHDHGYSPFRFDAAYPTETVTNSVQCITPKMRLFLNSGRDIQNDRWQDMTLRTELRLTPALTTTNSTAYDLNQGRWRDLVSKVTLDKNPRLTFGLDSRYDLEKERLRDVSTSASWVINPVWKVQWLGGYNAPEKKVLYNEVLLTRDLHCWDVSAYYSYQRKYFYLYFRLKALDIPLPQFGIGRGGQILGASQGVPF